MAQPLDFLVLGPNHLADCRSLFRLAFDQFAATLGRNASEEDTAWLDHYVAAGQVVGGFCDTELIGYHICEQADDGARVIFQIAVLPALRGTGIGRQLFDHIVQQARKDDVSYLRLVTAETMTDLIGLYRHWGFRIVRVTRPTHNLDNFPRVHMELQLR